MEIFNVIIGLFFIGLGFLVKAAPDLIAGYNTMPQSKKENVDIAGLSTFMRNGLIAIGLAVIVGYYFFKWMGLITMANAMIFVVTLVGTMILVVNAQKFDHNRQKKTKFTYIILGLTFVSVLGLIVYGYLPAKTIIQNDQIRFTGMYGLEMKTTEVNGIELADRIPAIKMRTNGFSFGSARKGTFQLDQFGKCKLFLHSNQGPYLIITDKNGEKIIWNDKDPKLTAENYQTIKSLINK